MEILLYLFPHAFIDKLLRNLCIFCLLVVFFDKKENLCRNDMELLLCNSLKF